MPKATTSLDRFDNLLHRFTKIELIKLGYVCGIELNETQTNAELRSILLKRRSSCPFLQAMTTERMTNKQIKRFHCV